MNQNPETQSAQIPQPTIDVLRAAREVEAARYSEGALDARLRMLDYAAGTQGTYANMTNSFFPSYQGRPTVHDMMAAEALDVPTDFFEAPESPELQTLHLTHGNEEVVIERQWSDFSTKLRIDGESAESRLSAQKSEAIAAVVTKRYEDSPPFAAIHQAHSEWAATEVKPFQIETQPFSIDEDRLATIAAFQQLGISPLMHASDTRAILDRTKDVPAKEFLNTIISIREYEQYQSEIDDNTTVIASRPDYKSPVSTFVTIDAEQGTAQVRWMQNPDYAYQERANQSDQETSIPFIETECARELSSALDEAGLMFHPRFQREMVAVSSLDDRYGSIYSEMSRQIAKWVNDPARLDITELFVGANPEYIGKADKHALYAYEHSEKTLDTAEVAKALATIDSSQMGEPAAFIINASQQCLDRAQSDESIASDLPVETGEVKMRDGSCFDVAGYYIASAADGPSEVGGLDHMTVNGVSMLEKSRHGRAGAHTFLTTQAMKFNGVDIPKGALLARSKNHKWSFLRLTPFTFDSESDRAATGSELAKGLQQLETAARQLGPITLETFISQARSEVNRTH